MFRSMELSLKSILPRRWCWLFLFFPLLGPAFALDPRLEQDTYGLGMGSAVVAVVGGTHAIEWNPAGIARASVPMAQLGLGYDPSSTSLSFNLSALYPLPDGTVFALSQFSEFPSTPGSTTTYVGTVGMPLNASHDLFLGINLKYLALSIVDGGVLQNGRGLGMDLGLAYDLRNAQGTMASFGLAVKDVATDVRFDNNAEQPVVRTFVIGAAYQNINWPNSACQSFTHSTHLALPSGQSRDTQSSPLVVPCVSPPPSFTPTETVTFTVTPTPTDTPTETVTPTITNTPS